MRWERVCIAIALEGGGSWKHYANAKDLWIQTHDELLISPPTLNADGNGESKIWGAATHEKNTKTYGGSLTLRLSSPAKIMPRRILLNTKYGGFNLSGEAANMYRELTKGVERPADWYISEDVKRDDPILLHVVDTLGLKASSGNLSSLGIAEIPDDVPEDGWIIQDYDGVEWVAEKHRKWNATPRPPLPP